MIWFLSLAAIGLCFILKYSSILNPIRDQITKITFFKKLIQCAQCLGFWIGIVFGSLWIAVFQTYIPEIGNGWNESLLLTIQYLLCGFYTSAICWLADHIIMVAQKYLYGSDIS